MSDPKLEEMAQEFWENGLWTLPRLTALLERVRESKEFEIRERLPGHDLEIADVARAGRDSEWVKAVKKARVKWLGNAVAACDEILREMGVQDE